jgi:hypothetical protein
MKIKTNTQIILTAEDGMYYTDGESYVKNVVLPLEADDSEWFEIAEEDMPEETEDFVL